MTKCRAMILTVGGTPAPVITAALEHQPEFICFIASGESYLDIPGILEKLRENGVNPRHKPVIIENADDLMQCFHRGADAVTHIRNAGFSDTHEVLVGYTGGTKSMSVGVSLAAITYGYNFTYVGGKARTKNGVGIVIDGTEQVYSYVNPWDFLGIDERRQASRFFNTSQFKAGLEILKELSERAIQQKTIYRRLAMIFDGYRQWDSFKHREGIACFKNAQMDELMEFELKDGVRRFVAETIALRKQLEQILSGSNQGKIPCIELAHDLYANAERRFAEGSVDDAILRLYRLVEMMAQMRLLEQYRITVSDVKPEQIPGSIRDEYVTRHTSWDGKIKLAQHVAYSLLRELGDDLGHTYQEHEKLFRNIQRARNESYLAHGFASSSDKTYQDLRQFILTLGVITPADAPRFPRIDL